ncbi:L-lactate dehydrogenase [Ruminococcus champanellensis]|uniref:L-lactate dehydrogenase n=1 Tax=Ruminococcus champanellensis TaxID=1161942 RepID=UPI0026DC6594|nr:L-lactate dehydrogenase [Ruminococcus champanellensis]
MGGILVNKQKCAVIGCGFVGASIAFSLVQEEMFSELVLIDINQTKAEGEAMDLSHGLPFVHPMKIYAGTYADLADCFLIIITAGAGQRPGETRLELVRKNVEIFRDMIPQITAVTQDARLLIVSNPVDVMTYAAWKLSGYPPEHVIGSGTVLDTARLKYLLGAHLGVDSRSVHAFIIGEHGDSELAVWSSANISGVDLDSFCDICGACDGETLHRLYEDVRTSAYKVIEKKGATYYAIALAVTRIARAIVREEHSVLPVSAYVNGHYGVSDVYFGVPSIVGAEGVEKVLDIPLDGSEQQQLEHSVQTLKDVIAGLDL